jgi:N-acetylmuramoyl-L-alanine amidase
MISVSSVRITLNNYRHKIYLNTKEEDNMITKTIKTLLAGIALTFAISLPASAATYKVTQGDSLYIIGSIFNTPASTIMADNKLTSSVIYPGQALYVRGTDYTIQSGYSLFTISKKFGISLYSLQKANNLWSDMIYPGYKIVIPNLISSNTTSAKAISYTASDVDLLARLITAEADGQPYNAMVGVGAVVVNRVKSGSFTNSISGVIYQKINGYYQFTPVLNGYINYPASAQAINAAKAALSGVDPTNGALFYFDDSSTNSWLWSKTIAARIDRMVFAY